MDENIQATLQDLYTKYADDVFRYAIYTLMDEEDALDTVQEVFLRAHKSWHRFRGEAAVKTWLFRIARNYINDILRKRKTERRYQQSMMSHGVSGSSEDLTRVEIQETLQQLPRRYRQVLILRAIEGFSVAETSTILRLSETNVRVTYHRAKKLLEKLLESQTDQHETGVRGGWI